MSNQPPAGANGPSETSGPAERQSHTSAAQDETGVPQGNGVQVLVEAAGSGGGPFRLTTAEAPISASRSVAISSQTSVLVPRGGPSAERASRLQPGSLVYRVDPQPAKLRRNEIELVKLRAMVAEDGRVTEVQRLSGSATVASAAVTAVREWRYSPTLLDGHPVKAEERITFAFRGQ